MEIRALTARERMAVALRDVGRKEACESHTEPLSEEVVSQLSSALLEEGLTYQQCADRFGTSRSAIAGYAYRCGIKKGDEKASRLSVKRFSWE